MKAKKIIVLMSTWNGEAFIAHQLNSILQQKINAELSILVRDDGSIDSTVNIIESYESDCIEVIRGQNLGSKESFLLLIQEATKRSVDYVAFADQDDVWEPKKLQAGVDMLTPIRGPALYCSALNLVDSSLKFINYYLSDEHAGFKHAIFFNRATGCSCVFNNSLLQVLTIKPDAKEIFMHDWWVYLVASALGQVVYDKQSYIKYRQHASNQIGLKIGLLSYWSKFLKLIKTPSKPSRITQANEFLAVYGGRLSDADRLYLLKIDAVKSSFVKRLFFSIFKKPAKKRMVNNLISLITFTLGR